MIVIIEGIDRVGKTTLCNMLQQHGYVSLDRTIYADKANTSIDVYDKILSERTIAQAQVLSMIPTTTKIVIDRFHLSQIVYGLLERNQDNIVIMQLIEDMLKHNSILVYVEPIDINWSSLEHGKDLSQHAAYFDALYESSVLTKRKTNYTSLDLALADILEVDNANHRKHS